MAASLTADCYVQADSAAMPTDGGLEIPMGNARPADLLRLATRRPSVPLFRNVQLEGSNP
jgi:hypothetical protein